jgi:hypothetical protein
VNSFGGGAPLRGRDAPCDGEDNVAWRTTGQEAAYTQLRMAHLPREGLTLERFSGDLVQYEWPARQSAVLTPEQPG